MTDNNDSTKKKYKGRWAPKEYSKEIIDFANTNLSESEQRTYNLLFEELAESNKLSRPQELLLLDMVVFDYMRVKRLHKRIQKFGDMTTFTTRAGTEIVKASEASYLLNAVETQLRNNMKELLLTKKEMTKQEIGKNTADFAKMMSTVDAKFEVEDERKDEETKDAEPSGTS